jgi:hypothetical protein
VARRRRRTPRPLFTESARARKGERCQTAARARAALGARHRWGERGAPGGRAGGRGVAQACLRGRSRSRGVRGDATRDPSLCFFEKGDPVAAEERNKAVSTPLAQTRENAAASNLSSYFVCVGRSHSAHTGRHVRPPVRERRQQRGLCVCAVRAGFPLSSLLLVSIFPPPPPRRRSRATLLDHAPFPFFHTTGVPGRRRRPRPRPTTGPAAAPTVVAAWTSPAAWPSTRPRASSPSRLSKKWGSR